MPNTIEAICPCCGIKATSLEEIYTLFGVRVTSKLTTQSYCRGCRSARCKAGEPCKKK